MQKKFKFSGEIVRRDPDNLFIILESKIIETYIYGENGGVAVMNYSLGLKKSSDWEVGSDYRYMEVPTEN